MLYAYSRIDETLYTYTYILRKVEGDVDTCAKQSFIHPLIIKTRTYIHIRTYPYIEKVHEPKLKHRRNNNARKNIIKKFLFILMNRMVLDDIRNRHSLFATTYIWNSMPLAPPSTWKCTVLRYKLKPTLNYLWMDLSNWPNSRIFGTHFHIGVHFWRFSFRYEMES